MATENRQNSGGGGASPKLPLDARPNFASSLRRTDADGGSSLDCLIYVKYSLPEAEKTVAKSVWRHWRGRSATEYRRDLIEEGPCFLSGAIPARSGLPAAGIRIATLSISLSLSCREEMELPLLITRLSTISYT